MDPAEAARGEHPYPCAGGEVSRGRDGRRPVAASGRDRREIAYSALRDVLAARDRPQRLLVEPDPGLAGDERGRGGHRPAVPDGRLHLVGHPQVARARQAVTDQRALERHHRPPAGHGLGDL
jgi:hypothetical protein